MLETWSLDGYFSKQTCIYLWLFVHIHMTYILYDIMLYYIILYYIIIYYIILYYIILYYIILYYIICIHVAKRTGPSEHHIRHVFHYISCTHVSQVYIAQVIFVLQYFFKVASLYIYVYLISLLCYTLLCYTTVYILYLTILICYMLHTVPANLLWSFAVV